MKKAIYIFLIFLNFYNTFGQDRMKNLKNRDTIYISFNEKEKFDDLHLKHQKYSSNEIYRYQYPDGKVLDFEFRKNVAVVKTKKSFLVNNKNSLFDINDFHKNDLREIIYNFDLKKIVIFVIDTNEIKGNKIYLKRVTMINKVPIEM